MGHWRLLKRRARLLSPPAGWTAVVLLAYGVGFLGSDMFSLYVLLTLQDHTPPWIMALANVLPAMAAGVMALVFGGTERPCAKP